MPVVGKLITGAIMANFSGKKILGRNAIDIADSVGLGVATHITTPNMLTFTCSGVVGPVGTAVSTSVVGIVPTVMANLMMAKAAQKGFGVGGKDMIKLFSAIAIGVGSVLNTSIVQGTFMGLAMGGGTAKLTMINSQILSNLIRANLSSKGILGRDAGKIADCVSYGIVTQLKSSAVYTIVVSGAIAPVAPMGPVPIAGIPATYSKII